MKSASLTATPVSRPRKAVEPSNHGAPTQGMGRVLVCCDDRYVVDIAGQPVQARRAASCLLLPNAGDVVAWCGGGGDPYFVFAVLERDSAAAEHCLELTGDTRLRIKQGDLRIETTQDMHLSAASLDAEVPDLQIRAERSSLILGVVDSIASTCNATFGSLRTVGSQMTSIFERVFQHSQTHQRVVEGIDQVQAGTADYQSKGLMSLRGQNVLTSGEHLVKTRAAQIQLG